jgi:hypothetical protein
LLVTEEVRRHGDAIIVGIVEGGSCRVGAKKLNGGEGPEAYADGYVSRRTRRITKIAIASGLVVIIALVAVNDFLERRAIDFRNAEEIYAELDAGGFGCDDPYFPTGNDEPVGYSRATCERGFITVDIGVAQERGQWLGSKGEPYEGRGVALLKGRNWWVAFYARSSDSLRLATQAQLILGGDIVKDQPQDDDA